MTRRSYDQFCGLARALDIVGERWTLLIVRDLALGPRRYSDLLDGLPGIGTGLLAERLKRLEAEGLARRAQLPPPAGVAVWELTDEGAALARAVQPLAMWGARRLDPRRRGQVFSADWLLNALGALARPERTVGVRAVYQFDVGADALHVVVDDGRVDVRRGPAPLSPDVVVAADVETLWEVGFAGLDPTQATAEGRLEVTGEPEAVRRMLVILTPPPAPGGRPPQRSA